MLNAISIITALVRLIPDIIKGLRAIQKELDHKQVSKLSKDFKKHHSGEERAKIVSDMLKHK